MYVGSAYLATYIRHAQTLYYICTLIDAYMHTCVYLAVSNCVFFPNDALDMLKQATVRLATDREGAHRVEPLYWNFDL